MIIQYVKIKIEQLFKKHKHIIILALILAVAVFFRFRHWPDYLPFDFEKSRDLIVSRNIYLNRKLTLIGPTTEVEGIFHGPLYYYLLGLGYYIFNGDPKAGSIVSFGFNFAALIALYFIGSKLFSKKVGLLASFLYAVSLEAVSYAYWLSNPGPSIVFLFLMFYFFYRFLSGEEKYLALSLFCFGLSLQFQVLNVLFLVPLALSYLLLGRPRINPKNLLLAPFSVLLPVSTFIFFDLKHQFLMTNAFLDRYLQNSQGPGLKINLLDYFTRLAREFSHVLFPVVPKLAGWFLMAAILFFLVWKIFVEKKDKLWKYLLIWIFATFPVFLINSRIGESSAAFMGVSGAIVLAAAAFMDQIFKKNTLLIAAILLLIGLVNLKGVDCYLTSGSFRLFDAYEDLYLKKDLSIIRWIYEKSEGQSFQLDTVTSPLYVSTLWDYLFSWYGQKEGLPAPSRENPKTKFLILEPFVDTHFKTEAIKKVGNDFKLSEEKDFGGVVIQKWELSSP
ncbi:MAG: glycosyltransferase family 39 protein [Patescibacteria group bacterium]|jgi:hypothetical protein